MFQVLCTSQKEKCKKKGGFFLHFLFQTDSFFSKFYAFFIIHKPEPLSKSVKFWANKYMYFSLMLIINMLFPISYTNQHFIFQLLNQFQYMMLAIELVVYPIRNEIREILFSRLRLGKMLVFIPKLRLIFFNIAKYSVT